MMMDFFRAVNDNCFINITGRCFGAYAHRCAVWSSIVFGVGGGVVIVVVRDVVRRLPVSENITR